MSSGTIRFQAALLLWSTILVRPALTSEPAARPLRPSVEQLPPASPMPAGLKLTHVDPWTALPAEALADEKLADVLRGATLVTRRFAPYEDRDDAGRLTIELERDLPLCIGVQWAGEPGSSEGIQRETWEADTFSDEGWLPVAMQSLWDPVRQTSSRYVIYYRECRVGEKFTVRVRRSVPPLLLTNVAASPLPAESEPAAELPERLQRVFVGTKTRLLLKAERYDELDRWIDGYLRTAAEFPSGHYRIRSAAAGFEWSGSRRGIAFYEPYVPLLERWLTKYPQSNGAKLVAADILLEYAQASSDEPNETGRADDVHRRALELLYDVEQADPTIPHLYQAYMELARDEQWDEELVNDYFRRAVKSKSWCPQAIGEYIEYLHTWHFERSPAMAARIQAAVEQAAAATRDRYGDMMYAACIKDFDYFYPEEPFEHFGFQWPRLKASFEQLLTRYPNSRRIVRAYCKSAATAGDRETARRLFDKLGPYDKSDDEGWDSRTEYELNRKWAADDYLRGEQRTVYDLSMRGVVSMQPTIAGPVFLDRKGWIYRLDVQTGAKRRPASTVAWIATGLAAAPTGDLFIAGHWRSGATVVAAENSFEPVRLRTSDEMNVMSVALSDKRTAAIGGDDGRVFLVDLTAAEPELRADRTVEAAPDGRVVFVGFTPNGESLITFAQGEVRVWDVAAAEQRRRWRAGPGGAAAALSPDGKTLATDCGDGILRFWDVGAGTQLGEVRQAAHRAGVLAFSPDGRRLAVGQGGFESIEPAAIVLVDVLQRAIVRTWTGHKGAVRGLVFSNDGKTLVSASMDRSARLWDVAATPNATPAKSLDELTEPRAIAERLLAMRSKLRVATRDGKEISVQAVAELPAGEFDVLTIDSDSADPLTDADLETLGRLRKLRQLQLHKSRITGPGLVHLTHLPNLTLLRLSQCPLTDEAYDHLARLTRLSSLDLGFTMLDDVQAAKLANLKELQIVTLTRTQVTDASMPMFARLPRLERINLDDTKVGDAGVEALSQRPLTVLALRNTPITDRCIPSLARFKALRALYLTGTSLSDEAVDSLRKQLSNPSAVRFR